MEETFNITSLRWVSAEQKVVLAVVDGDQYTIPADLGNRHYKYIVDNNLTIDPADETVTHTIVTKVQFMKQAKASAKFADLKTWYTGLAADDDARIEIEFGETLDINGAFAQGAKTALGLTDQQLETFFNNAGAI